MLYGTVADDTIVKPTTIRPNGSTVHTKAFKLTVEMLNDMRDWGNIPGALGLTVHIPGVLNLKSGIVKTAMSVGKNN